MPISKQSSRKNTASSRSSKYHNIKTGKSASRKEARRKRELEILERCGEIRSLRFQVPYELIPAQREPPTIGKRGGIKPGKCIEKSCKYVADFVYEERSGDDWIEIVEDSKGYRTPDYKIKRKLMLFLKGIRIRET